MSSGKLPNGATAVRVGPNGEHVIVSPMNAFHPPRVDYLKGGRVTALIPADAIERHAARSLNPHDASELRRLVANLRGDPPTD